MRFYTPLIIRHGEGKFIQQFSGFAIDAQEGEILKQQIYFFIKNFNISSADIRSE